MITFKKQSNQKPYIILRELYDLALKKHQPDIQAISIASYSASENEVSTRYVNLKFIINDQFIFFSNYNSPKATAFNSHNQIAALIYWSRINVQIRIKATIEKTSEEFNYKYFYDRSDKKNALAISSNQSKPISTYEKVIENYNNSLKNDDLKTCPEYWGGFSFVPYEVEFWQGSEFRLNRRNLYKKEKNTWKHFILEP